MNEPTLNKDDFWKLIQEAHTSKDQTDDEYLDTLQAALVKQGPENVLRFKEIMDTYLEIADAPGLYEAAVEIKAGCNDDVFLNFRAWLLAQGKEAFLGALADPDTLANLDLPFGYCHTLPQLCQLERLMYVPYYAYHTQGNGSIYEDLQPLPTDTLEGIRAEVEYAPGIGNLKRTAEEIEKALPLLCSKIGGDHNPDWFDDTNIPWGCDWATKAAAPQSEPKL